MAEFRVVRVTQRDEDGDPLEYKDLAYTQNFAAALAMVYAKPDKRDVQVRDSDRRPWRWMSWEVPA